MEKQFPKGVGIDQIRERVRESGSDQGDTTDACCPGVGPCGPTALDAL